MVCEASINTGLILVIGFVSGLVKSCCKDIKMWAFIPVCGWIKEATKVDNIVKPQCAEV